VHVGCVGDEEVHAAPQRSRQRLIEVAFVHLTPGGGNVASGAPHRGWVDVDGVQLDPIQGHDHRHADCAGATAQVNDDSSWPLGGEGRGLADEELGAAARHEDSGIHGYPQAAELRPAEDVLQGKAGDSPVDHGGEVVRRTRSAEEQPRLVLGEDTAGSPKSGDDNGSRQQRRGERHGSLS